MKKYELLKDETKVVDGATLYRIRALKDFGNVKAGETGGWIESEENLSHEGNCWVSGDAWVLGDARVFGNAQVYDDVIIGGKSVVCGNSRIGSWK